MPPPTLRELARQNMRRQGKTSPEVIQALAPLVAGLTGEPPEQDAKAS